MATNPRVAPGGTIVGEDHRRLRVRLVVGDEALHTLRIGPESLALGLEQLLLERTEPRPQRRGELALQVDDRSPISLRRASHRSRPGSCAGYWRRRWWRWRRRRRS